MSLGDLLARFVGGPKPPLIGFVYVADGEGDDLMAGAAVGETIRIPGKGPPWLVVDNSIERVIPAKWPGRLWRVEMTRVVAAEDQLASGGVPGPEHGYTRAAAVTVLEELPLTALFGAHGAEVLRVIDAAGALTDAQARTLCDGRHPDAPQACARVWRAWLGDRKPWPPNMEDFTFNGTMLMMNDGARPVSPVSRGLIVVHVQVFRRAMEVAGDAAIEEDGDDVWLVDPWRGASSALIDAALALGAPEHVTPQDRAILTQTWTRAFGV